MADALEITQLIDKQLKATISKPEKARLDAWLGESGENRLFMEKYANMTFIRKDVMTMWTMNEKRMDQAFVNLFGKTANYIPHIPNARTSRIITAVSWTLAAAALFILIIKVPWTSLWTSFRQDSFSHRSVTIKQLLAEMNKQVTKPVFSYSETPSKELSRNMYDSLPEERLAQFGNYLITRRDSRYLAVVLIEQPVFNNNIDDSVISTFFIPPDIAGWQVLLPDSSKIILDPGSSLSLLLHPSADIMQQRTVILAGSATIDVHGNHEIPFKVLTNRLQLSTLGTLFKVRDHQGEDGSSTVLYRGKLSVDNGVHKDTLLPRQRAITDLHSTAIRVTTENSTIDSIPWNRAYFDFSKEKLPASMKRIAAWYNIPHVQIRPGVDITTPGKLSEGRVGKDLTLSQFMKEVDEPDLHIKLMDNNKTLVVTK